MQDLNWSMFPLNTSTTILCRESACVVSCEPCSPSAENMISWTTRNNIRPATLALKIRSQCTQPYDRTLVTLSHCNHIVKEVLLLNSLFWRLDWLKIDATSCEWLIWWVWRNLAYGILLELQDCAQNGKIVLHPSIDPVSIGILTQVSYFAW